MHRQTAIFQLCLKPPPGICSAAPARDPDKQPSPVSARSEEGPSFVPVEKLSWAQYLAKWPWLEN